MYLKKILVLAVSAVVMAGAGVNAQDWKPVGNRIKTKWAKDVTPQNAWKDYPRPQLVRENWQNLNGMWDYAIQPKGKNVPETFQGKILVPFCVESSLSGVGKAVTPNDELWYKKQFTIPAGWAGKNIKLHFGAVDWQTTVLVNGKQVGEHKGGSDPFTFDITSALKTGSNEIVVKVWDPTDTGIQPRGKQVLKPVGFWYTAVTGIWQTVWLEPVNKTSLEQVLPEADIDNQKITIRSVLANAMGNEKLLLKITQNGKLVKELTETYKPAVSIKLDNPKLWTPETPDLYHFSIQVERDGKVLDKANSYFAMRKISMGKDANGNMLIQLNNKPTFMWGTLDQGWWPESLLTPPTAEAMLYDMQILKQMGFNMLRKHIKVEPAQYYYQADSIGLMLWQDMPSGFNKLNDPDQHVKWDSASDWDRPKDSAVQFEKEWKSIIDNLRFFPSIVVWVPFNEGWGQFDSKRIVKWTQDYDKSRLVDGISGWADRKVGDMYDAHQYPGPSMEPGIQNPGRTMVLGEFGGLGWPVEGHLWKKDSKNWGYRTYFTSDKFLEEYTKLIDNLQPLRARGLAGAIYTQTTDVELEVNGLMTYDREVIKLPVEKAKEIHKKLFENADKAPQFLVKDSEVEPSKLNISFEQPSAGWKLHNPFDAKFKQVTGPAKVKKGQNLWAVTSFQKPVDLDGLAMKLYAQGDLTIYLNGEVIYTNEKILTKRHYDELNISDYKKYLKDGKNVIGLELKNAEADSDFDFGIYQF